MLLLLRQALRKLFNNATIFSMKILLILFLLAPFLANASVVISEIAWMGTAESATKEWIELKNTGSEDLDLSGWMLEALDGSPKISLSNIISTDSFFLLERSSDDTVPGIASDLIYTGALSNSGEILILKDNNGNEVDRVDGSDGWSIGGNNTTKETLQLTSSGWVTASPTPKAENENIDTLPSESQGSGSDDRPVSDSGIWLPVQETKIRAYAGVDKTVLVGAMVVFEGIAEDGAGEALSGARFLWNFGDGSIMDSQKVTHEFLYPGTYTVFLDVSFGLYGASDLLSVAVIPSPLRISEIKPGDFIEIQNDSSRTIDVSSFGISVGPSTGAQGKPFFFPSNTLIAPRAFLALGSNVLGFSIPASGGAKLLYPDGSIMLSFLFPYMALGIEESVSFDEGPSSASGGGGWVKTEATPGAKNKIVKTVSKKPAVPATKSLRISDNQQGSQSELAAVNKNAALSDKPNSGSENLTASVVNSQNSFRNALGKYFCHGTIPPLWV